MSVTYYLGAGASAKKIPCVVDLVGEIDVIINFIQQNIPTETIEFRINKQSYTFENDSYKPIQTALDLLKGFREDLSGQLSIDTLAKIYRIRGEKEKSKVLKAILFTSLIYWENRGVDIRYLNFWATIALIGGVGNDSSVGYQDYNGEINILSWNYDCQLERSFEMVFKDENGIWDPHGSSRNKKIFKHTGVNFLKLNGSASFSESFMVDSPRTKGRYLYDMTNKELACFIVQIVADSHGRFEEEIDNLKFSWEHENYLESPQNIKDRFYKIDHTETLVVIGYTFPSINHLLDSYLIQLMTGLKKVYFQGKDLQDAIKIKSYFKAVLPANQLKDDDMIPIDSTGFFIPPEATLVIQKKPINWQAG